MGALQEALVKAGLADEVKVRKAEAKKQQREEAMREEERDRPRIADIEGAFDSSPDLEPKPRAKVATAKRLRFYSTGRE